MLPYLYGALALPFAAAVAVLLSGTKQTIKKLHIGCSLAESILLFIIVYGVHVDGPISVGFIYIDQLSVIVLSIVAFLILNAALFSASYMEKELETEGASLSLLKRYYMLLNLFSFTMIAVLVLANLGLMWVAVEATTLASTLLVAFYFSRSAVEAAWKYVMVCTVGICLAMLGTILLYYAQLSAGPGSGEPLNWLALRSVSSQFDAKLTKMAFVFIVIGYGTKVGLAPMHTWLPDAHSQAPSPVSGLLSGGLLSCALYAIMRNVAAVAGSPGFDFIEQLLIALGIFSVLVAVPFLLVQHDIKRLFAYSSVEHMGLIAMAAGIGTPLALYAALLQLFNHAIVKSALFYLAGVLAQEYRTKNILRIRGVMEIMPGVGTAFILFCFAITGVPPFGIFFSKTLIIWSAFAGGYPWLGAISLLLLAAVFSGVFYYCVQMCFSSPVGVVRATSIGKPAMLAMTISMIVMTLTGFYLPAGFETLLRQAAAIVCGG